MLAVPLLFSLSVLFIFFPALLLKRSNQGTERCDNAVAYAEALSAVILQKRVPRHTERRDNAVTYAETLSIVAPQ